MIFARLRRPVGLLLLFLLLFVTALLLQALILFPIAFLEEGLETAGALCVSSVRQLFDWQSQPEAAIELVLLAAVLAGTQVAFVCPLVGPITVQSSGRSLRASVIVAILMAMFLSGGVLMSVLQAILLLVVNPGSPSLDSLDALGGQTGVTVLFITVWLAIGAAWTVLLWGAGRSRDPAVIARATRWILAGSGVEIVLAVPLYALARRREDCYCSLATFWSILVGTTALFWLCGPWAVLFLTRDFRRNWARGACTHCGYPKRSGSAVCTECGKAV